MPRGRPKKTTNDMLLKSAEMIGWAIGGIEREIAQTRERLASLTAQAASLRARVGGGASRTGPGQTGAAPPSPAAAPSGRRRTAGAAPERASKAGKRPPMSPEARQKISERMRKTWADRKRKNKK
jgi:hypothetical protein